MECSLDITSSYNLLKEEKNTAAGLSASILFAEALTFLFPWPRTLNIHVQRILLQRPRLVSDHFYLATCISYPNQDEAEDIGHLKYML